MKDYSKMSDFEVNNEVAMLWLKDYRYEYYQHGTCDGVEVYSECGFVDRYDYCNNPSDAWPIMLANGIATITENGKIIGATNNSQEYYENFGSIVYGVHNKDKPLRAAMIVYLMMKGEEK